jgi:predicted Holliday junction resolvase-like endonuclease
MDTYVQLILYLMILIQSQAVYLVSFKINKLQTNDNLHKSEWNSKISDKIGFFDRELSKNVRMKRSDSKQQASFPIVRVSPPSGSKKHKDKTETIIMD